MRYHLQELRPANPILAARTKPATQVFVTGTFDKWSKSVELEKTDKGFEKTVELPDASDKILYKVRRHCFYPYRAQWHHYRSCQFTRRSRFLLETRQDPWTLRCSW